MLPLYSHLRIGTLKHLIKSMALQGQGATARFDELVEEVATLKTINYGAGNEDSVGDESIKADLFISEIQEALARHWHVIVEAGKWKEGEVDAGRRRGSLAEGGPERERGGGVRKWEERGYKKGGKCE